MSKNYRRFFSSALAAALSLTMAFSLAAVSPVTVSAAAVDEEESEASVSHALKGSFDEMEVPTVASEQPNRLPLTGYYSKSFTVGDTTRSAKIYIADGARIRSYFTVIAVPDGVDTDEFLEENGWFEIADENKEGLFILEPGEDGWGTAEEEADYVNAAMSFYTSNKYFSIYGENYLAGYGKGASALERWAAANPLKVISQVYVDSDGLDQEYLETTGATVYPTQNGSYSKIDFPDDFTLLEYKDTVLPTWYIGGDPEDSLEYWKECNDCDEEPTEDTFGEVYAQSEDSERWMTDYAGPISMVAVQEETEVGVDLTLEMCMFLYQYTRYENAFSYSNGLYKRRSYDEDCFRTIEVNGTLREYMVYEPEDMVEDAPVMVVFPGNTQTDLNFIDATQWQDVADSYGFLLVILCETYNTATTVTFKDPAPFYEAVIEEIKEEYEGRINPGRIYANGQSMGGMYAQGFGSTNPEYFAAVASTSGCLMDAMTGDTSKRTYLPIPCFMIYGMGDNVNFSGNLWDDTDNQLDDWAEYYTTANGVSLSDVAYEDGEVETLDNNGHRTLTTWIWTKEIDGVDVPVFQVGQNSARAHNCMPMEEEILFDFARHYSVEYDAQGNVIARYYSPSAFEEEGDEIAIYEASKIATSLSITSSLSLTTGGKKTISCSVSPATAEIEWSSSDTSVATVSASGVVTAKAAGTAIITAASGKLTASCIVKVAKASQKITTSFASQSVAYKSGATYKLKAVTTGNGKLTYSSSNTKVAKVSSKGTITIKGTGKAVITITAAETTGYKKATKTITVKVVPAKATVSKAVSTKKACLTITVKKDSTATGYQVQVSTSKKFTTKTTKTVTLTKYTKVTASFTKLSAGKTYYVRARAYKTIDKKACYGAYSSVKSVKTKK